MNILFTLCGRAGSKGVKGKNIRNFCGIPLVWYSLSAVSLYQDKYSSNTQKMYVALSTDSEELIRLAKSQTQVPLHVVQRDPSLAGDIVPKVAVIRDCLNRAESHYQCNFDMVVDLDITSPLRTVNDIYAAIQKKMKRPAVDVVYSVTHSRRNPYFNMVREENGYFERAIKSVYTTRQEAPVFYDMNGSIYAYSPIALKEKPASSFFNDNADVIIMRDTGILDIDSEGDYVLMQVIAEYLYTNYVEYGEIKKLAESWLKSQSK